MTPNDFDPLAYIENAFLDRKKRDVVPDSDDLSVAIPSISEYINGKEPNGQSAAPSAQSATAVAEPVVIEQLEDEPIESPVQVLTETRPAPTAPKLFEVEPVETEKLSRKTAVSGESNGRRTKFKKTLMSAPRPRRAKSPVEVAPTIDPDLQGCWETLPKSIEFLTSYYDDSVTANYYRGGFDETRNDLIKRLLDPELSLEETSRLLGVCPATVRRYTNRDWLTHHRTQGGQRRFRLSDIVKFVEVHGRFPEA